MAKKKALRKKATSKKATRQKATRKKAATRKATRKKAARRELIDTGTDKRLVRRDTSGRFKESDDLGRALSMDRRRKAKRATKSGQGDKGDRRR